METVTWWAALVGWQFDPLRRSRDSWSREGRLKLVHSGPPYGPESQIRIQLDNAQIEGVLRRIGLCFRNDKPLTSHAEPQPVKVNVERVLARGHIIDSERSVTSKASEKAVSMSFDKEGEVLLVQLQTVDGATEFALEARDVEFAKNDGMVPKAGQAKILLGNTTAVGVVVMIDEGEHKVGVGVGSEDLSGTVRRERERGIRLSLCVLSLLLALPVIAADPKADSGKDEKLTRGYWLATSVR